MADGSRKPSEKIQVGDELRTLQLLDNRLVLGSAAIESMQSVFTNEAWEGVKLSWSGGKLYGDRQMVLLLKNGQAKAVTALQCDSDGFYKNDESAVEQWLAESGKVLCGRLSPVLKRTNSDKTALFYNTNGLWVGDALTEKMYENNAPTNAGNSYIFKGNAWVRNIRIWLNKNT
ncbi:hypothetical protein GC194_01635 [bacterium]|nr:hypothetical protein [bacterium]